MPLEMRPAEYARYRMVSRPAIKKAIDQGRIPASAIRIDDAGIKWINVAAADFALGQARQRVKIEGPISSPADFVAVVAPAEIATADAPSLTKARTRTEEYNAEIRRLEFEQRIGKLLQVEDVGMAMQRWAEVVVREVDQLPAGADNLAEALSRDGVQGLRLALRDTVLRMRSNIEQNMRLLTAGDDEAAADDGEAAPQ